MDIDHPHPRVMSRVWEYFTVFDKTKIGLDGATVKKTLGRLI